MVLWIILGVVMAVLTVGILLSYATTHETPQVKNSPKPEKVPSWAKDKPPIPKTEERYIPPSSEMRLRSDSPSFGGRSENR